MHRNEDDPDEAPMTKAQAIALLGGTQAAASERIGIKPQAVQAWPSVLSDKLRDRVQAALWRDHCAQQQLARIREARRQAALLHTQAHMHSDASA